MDKSSFLYSKIFSKTNVALFLIAAMLVGFLCARAVGSVAIFLFAVNALRDIPPRQWFAKKWWLFGLIWVGMYAISGFWTETQGPWNDPVQTKLPFLLLPIAFSFLPAFRARDVRIYTVILLVLISGGISWSLSFLPGSFKELTHIYSHSKSIRTPVYGDHISFSVAVAACVAWCAFSAKYWASRSAKIILLLVAICFSVYLHILAAKTGLLALYLFLIIQIGHLFYADWKKGIAACVVLVLLVTLAYKFVPTFHEKIDLVKYNHALYSKGQKDGNYSDIGRILSYDVAGRIIKEHPLIGVGAGDMMPEMSKGYDRWQPQIQQDQRLIPHNQFIIVALAAGIPASIAFLLWLVAPFQFVKRNRNSFFFVTVWLMLLVPLFTDTALEVQFGVFVYLFFFLMQRHMLVHRDPVIEE